MFWKLPKIWIFLSATTIRVLVTFSTVYWETTNYRKNVYFRELFFTFVRPPVPLIRPIARPRWSPFSVCLTSSTWKVSRKSSSSRTSAKASSMSKPYVNAVTKSTPFWSAPISVVALPARSSTCFFFALNLISSLSCLTIGSKSFCQASFKGVSLLGGMGTRMLTFYEMLVVEFAI